MPPSTERSPQQNDMPPSRKKGVQRNDSPPLNRKNKKWLIVLLTVSLVVVLSVGIIVFSANIINRDADVKTTNTPIVTQIVSQPASQPVSGNNADIAGVWRIDHFVVAGEIVSGDSGIDVTYIYTFSADGSVTRDNGVIETGSYVRDGNVIVASFNDGDYKFEYSSDAKSMSAVRNEITSVYSKDGQPVQELTEPVSQPANGSNADIAGVWRIDHFVVGGEKVSGDSGIGLTYIYTFNADGSVTRDNGVIETGSYVRDGNVIIASFYDGDYEFEYSAAAKSMTVETGDLTSVYGKDGQPVQDVTELPTSA